MLRKLSLVCASLCFVLAILQFGSRVARATDAYCDGVYGPPTDKCSNGQCDDKNQTCQKVPDPNNPTMSVCDCV